MIMATCTEILPLSDLSGLVFVVSLPQAQEVAAPVPVRSPVVGEGRGRKGVEPREEGLQGEEVGEPAISLTCGWSFLGRKSLCPER